MGYLLFSFMTESDALAFLGNPFLHLVTLVAKFNLSLHPQSWITALVLSSRAEERLVYGYTFR